MPSLRKSIFLSVGGNQFLFGIQFIVSIVVARLLTPEQIGIFSIGSLILSFSHVFRDLGISNYIIQERELTEDRLRTAQTILFATCWSLALILWLASPGIAMFYGDHQVGQVVQILTLNFVILPFGALANALIKRNMQFDRLFKINFGAALVQAIFSIGLSVLGFGPLSLAWAGVAGTATAILLTRFLSSHRVSLFPSLTDWRHVFGTAGRFSGVSLLWEAGATGPELIVGKAMGIEAAGFLGRAQGVVGLAYRTIMEGLSPVLMPHFAKGHRDGTDVGSQYLKALEHLSAITIPVFCCLMVVMDVLVPALYGDQWHASIAPARIICIGMLLTSITVVGGSAVAGMGEVKYSLRFQLVGQPVKLGLVVIACYFSLDYVATALVVGELLIAVYVTLVLRSLTNFPINHFLRCMGSSVFIAMASVGGCLVFRTVTELHSNVQIVLGCMATSALCWLVCVMMLNHPLHSEIRSLISH